MPMFESNNKIIEKTYGIALECECARIHIKRANLKIRISLRLVYKKYTPQSFTHNLSPVISSKVAMVTSIPNWPVSIGGVV